VSIPEKDETMQDETEALQQSSVQGCEEAVSPTEHALTALPAPATSVAQFEAGLDEWIQKRAVITRFLTHELRPGVDYGPIHLGKDCQDYKKKKKCDNPFHWSKDVLFKPGSEKVAGLLQLRATFERDNDMWEMLGQRTGVLCLRCLLLAPSGEIVGEGRGARDVEKQDYGDINKAIKQCQKSAQIDAVLRVVGLSDVFTQDLDGQKDDEDDARGEKPTRTESTPAGGATPEHTPRSAIVHTPLQPVTPAAPARTKPAVVRPSGDSPAEKHAALLYDIKQLLVGVLRPFGNKELTQAFIQHSFGVDLQALAEQPLATLEGGIETFTFLCHRLMIMVDPIDGSVHDWIQREETTRHVAPAPAANDASPEGVDPATGEDLRGLPSYLLSKEEQEAQREQENAALLDKITA
jgi:hypothetical protein